MAEARKHFEALIATDPNDARIWNNIATQYMQCRYTSDAQGIILLGWAREHLRKAIELRPRYPDPFMNMGIIELRSGNFAQANEILRKGLAMPLPDGAARIANRLGMVWWEVGRPLDALSYFRDALRMDSNLADAHNNEGFILDLLGFDAEAMASYRKAIALEPNHADAHFNVGTLYMKGKDPNRAVAEIERSIALNPGSAKGHLALAQLLDSQGKTVEALASVRKTIKIDSNMVPALILVASILATHPDSNIRDGDHALLYAQKASRLTGMTDPAILDVLAAAYAETGDYTLAAETARKAVELLKQQGQEAQAAQVVERLRLYEAGKPYRRAAQ